MQVNLDERPPTNVESAAYFIVAESLTNIAKHSDAHHARVNVNRDDSRLRVEITDDGRGGARLEPGGGLSGLADRVAVARRHVPRREPRGRSDHDHRGASVRVVILEDSVLLKEGIVRLLAGYGHEAVAQLETTEGFLEAVVAHEPDLVIADVRLPPTFTDEGIQAAIAAPGASDRRNPS